MSAVSGYRGNVYITATPSVSFTNMAMTDSGDHQHYTTPSGTYTQRYWDNTQPLTVQTSATGSGGWATVTNYTAQYVGGALVFSVPNTNTFVRVSGNYFTYSALGDGHSWDLSMDSDIYDASTFTNAWKIQIPGQLKASGSFAKFYNDGSFLSLMSAGALMVFILFTDALSGPAPQNGPRYEAYGYIKQDQLKQAVNATVDESLSFEITSQLYYVAN